jgi:hypothetical protein
LKGPAARSGLRAQGAGRRVHGAECMAQGKRACGPLRAQSAELREKQSGKGHEY